jgi:hypothetical protein
MFLTGAKEAKTVGRMLGAVQVIFGRPRHAVVALFLDRGWRGEIEAQAVLEWVCPARHDSRSGRRRATPNCPATLLGPTGR